MGRVSKVPLTKNCSKKHNGTKKSKTFNAADASALASTDTVTPAPVTQSNSFTAAKVLKMVCDASHLISSVRATPKPASSMAHSTVTRALALWAHT